MSQGEITHHRVRHFLRSEAIKNGHFDIYKAYIQRAADARVWSFSINGDAVGVAITHGSNIEVFHVAQGEKKRRKYIAESILVQMYEAGYVVATMMEADRDKLEFWKDIGFKPKGRVHYLHLQDWRSPEDMKMFDGEKKAVSVKFFDRSDSGEVPFAELDDVGILSENHTLHLPQLAVAFDGLPEKNVGRRWVSVSIDGKLQVEARFDTAKARELGLKRDTAGTPYISTVDLYTPTLI
jgi:hypothetical protein